MTVDTINGMGPALRMLPVREVASLPVEQVLARLASSPDGLTTAESSQRLGEAGPNALRTHQARPFDVFVRQARSPLFVLLVVAAAVSFLVGERVDAVIIV